ncbi:MAG TPA: amidohydrolase family protein, partial [Dehalococcoidia bacterium]|nr:amidohydrolase family protein [Dehalococcoidia bacterium]
MNKEIISLLIRGGHIIDPSQGIDQIGDVLIVEGMIVHLGGKISTVIASEAKQFQAIDAAGLVVSPGFIDLHCHLREPGFEDKETIATGTKAAAIGGFTTICCMPNTEPPLDNAAVVDWVKRKAGKDSLV